jgi:hypothetical protein
MWGPGSQGHVSTIGVHKREKKEVCGQPAVEARARARDGSRSRWGALAELGEAGSGFGRRLLPRREDRAILPLRG